MSSDSQIPDWVSRLTPAGPGLTRGGGGKAGVNLGPLVSGSPAAKVVEED